MIGNSKVVDPLNGLLADELTAINQYMVHSEVNSVRGYKCLHGKIEKRAMQEMKHAEDLIERIILLGGKPVVSELNPISTAFDVPGQLANDRDLELVAVENYNAAIKVACDAGDYATSEFLEDILCNEEKHLKHIEAMQGQIKDMGLDGFLSTKV